MTNNCLCAYGKSLRQAWTDEVEAHAAPEHIYYTMQAYFMHKATCPDCCPPAVLAHNRLYYPELFPVSEMKV